MTFNPRKDFQDNLNRRNWWASVIENAYFVDAISAAHLHMQGGLNAPNDLATAASYAYRIEGAKQFASILMNLAEGQKESPKIERRDNLTHQK